MKSESLKQCGQFAAVALVIALLTMSAGAQSQQSASGLEGTWRVQVTLYNCADPTLTFPPFWSLLSFHRGGTETETTTNPALLPGQRSPGHGVWKFQGNGQYSMVVDAFILFDSPTTPPGFKTGSQKIIQTVTMVDSDDFISDGTVNFFLTDGTAYRSGCAKSTGYRLTDDPNTP